MSYLHVIPGTVIQSALDYDQFCNLIGENAAINNAISSYVPCDGRSILGSRLEIYTRVSPTQPAPEKHILNVPDLRGRFVRGLNTFYSPAEPVFDLNTADADGQGRKMGDYQADEFRQHQHTMDGSVLNCGSHPPAFDVINGTSNPSRAQLTRASGGSETRPRNVALYFYIKIN